MNKFNQGVSSVRTPILWATLAFYLSVAASWAQQPPPNDHLTNAIVCTGNTLVITGSTAHATMDDFEAQSWSWYDGYPNATSTVWYSWTPSQPSLVVVERIGSTLAEWQQESSSELGVFTGDYFTNDYGQPRRATKLFSMMFRYLWSAIPFYASAGTNYHFGINSCLPDFALRVTAYPTNASVFIEQPRSQTVTAGGSAFFSAKACSLEWQTFPSTSLVARVMINQLAFSWYKDGMPISADPAGCVSLANVTAQDAGAYTVVASNWKGMATSSVAFLYVTPTNSMPGLNAARQSTSGQPQFLMTVSGETGRCYRVESSTNLVAWQQENSFNDNSRDTTSILLLNGNQGWFSNKLGAIRKFFRLSSYQPANGFCINQLKQIRFAKDQWAEENKREFLSIPSTTDFIGIDKYIKTAPQCPSGGTYTFNNMSNLPTCSIPGHQLEEPR